MVRHLAAFSVTLCALAPFAYAAHRPQPHPRTTPRPAAARSAEPHADAQPEPAVELPIAATPELIAWPNPSSPPAWIQWLGWSNDGTRVAWRQGPEWAQLLTGTPIEIVRVDQRGASVAHLHQRGNPAVALRERHIRSTEPLFVERKSERDVLLRTSNGRTLAIVVRPGPTSTAAVLEKNRSSYDPIARWLVRGPGNRVDVMAFEDLSHRLLALVVHTDSGPVRQAQLALVPLSRKISAQVSALTLPEAVTTTSPRPSRASDRPTAASPPPSAGAPSAPKGK